MFRPRLVRFASLLVFSAAAALFAAPPPLDLKVHATLSGHAPGNITVTPDGRILLSMHQFSKPRFPVMELGDDGKLRPFPSLAFHMSKKHGGQLGSVLGIQCDQEGVVWMLDNGLAGKTPPQLVAWDTLSDRLHQRLAIPSYALRTDSFVNDLIVDRDRERIYIADPASGTAAAIIVIDLISGLSRRVLQGHWSVVAEEDDLVIAGRPVEVKGPGGEPTRPHLGVNPIAMDPEGRWVYFGPMHGTSLYRVPAEVLASSVEPDGQSVERFVERYADRPIIDGITVSSSGTVYYGDLAAEGLGATDPEGARRFATGANLSWVDAFSYAPDGRVYAVANRLQDTPQLSAGKRRTTGPFHVVSFRPDSGGMNGR